MQALYGTGEWKCGVTSACLVTTAKVYSFTELQTIGGIIKCEWYKFCEQKNLLPTHIQPLVPNIHKLSYTKEAHELIARLSRDFGCVLTERESPKFGNKNEVLYVEMQHYKTLANEKDWIIERGKFYDEIQECIQLFCDQLPEQLSNLVCQDLGPHNIALDNGQLILLDPVYT